MILVIDNYDSFVFNLARYLQQLGQQTHVLRNDELHQFQDREGDFRAAVISPGPGTPQQAGGCVEFVRRYSGRLPLLGICLGHQVIAEAFGGHVVRASEPVHGRADPMYHDGDEMFRDMPSPFLATRYHSLAVERTSMPDCLQTTARTGDRTIMALRHRDHLTVGLQFHPESILTQGGYRLLANFLDLAGIPRGEPPLPEWTPPTPHMALPPAVRGAPCTF